MKVILGKQYINFEKSLARLDIETLKDRRESLCLNFAKMCLKNPKTKSMFPKTSKIHQMKTRNPEEYQVQNAKTDRLRKSAVIYMQNLLNKN